MKNKKSCDDLQWDIASWMNRNVDRIKLTLRLIAKANEEFKSHSFERRLELYRRLHQDSTFNALFVEPTPTPQDAMS